MFQMKIDELINRISRKQNSTWKDVRGCKHNLVEQRAVRDRKSKSIQAHSQHHVVRRIITVAPAAAVEEPRHRLSAEHHAAAPRTDTRDTQTYMVGRYNEYKSHNGEKIIILLHIAVNDGLLVVTDGEKKKMEAAIQAGRQMMSE